MCRVLLGGVRGVLGAGRDCRYSGARRGIGCIRGHWGSWGGAIWGIRGCRGCQGCIGVVSRPGA